MEISKIITGLKFGVKIEEGTPNQSKNSNGNDNCNNEKPYQ